MRGFPEVFAFIFCAALGFSILFSFWEMLLVLTFKKTHAAPWQEAAASSVTVLRPMRGGEVETSYSLLQTLYHQTLAPSEIRYGVDSPGDSIVSVVKRLHEEFPQIPMRLSVGASGNGQNKKIAKLAELAKDCNSMIVMAVDQDIAMPPNHLKDVLSRFLAPKTGMVTCLYRIGEPATLFCAMELLAIHADFFPFVLAGEKLQGGLRFAFGATLAMRREVLEKIGGFEGVVDFLADDHELGARVWKAGYRVVLSDSIVEHAPGKLGWREYWNRQIRAARTHRVVNPVGFAFSVLTQGLPWAIALPALSGFSAPLVTLLVLWMLARVLAVMSSHYVLTQGRASFRPLFLLPFHEAARFLFWILAFTGNKVKWGNKLYEVSRSGKMRQVEEDRN